MNSRTALAWSLVVGLLVGMLAWARGPRVDMFAPFNSAAILNAVGYTGRRCPKGYKRNKDSDDKGKECVNKKGEFTATVAQKPCGPGYKQVGFGDDRVCTRERVATKDKWKCNSQDGKFQGAVKIDWGFTQADAEWACNAWHPGCNNACHAGAFTEQEYERVMS